MNIEHLRVSHCLMMVAMNICNASYRKIFDSMNEWKWSIAAANLNKIGNSYSVCAIYFCCKGSFLRYILCYEWIFLNVQSSKIGLCISTMNEQLFVYYPIQSALVSLAIQMISFRKMQECVDNDNFNSLNQLNLWWRFLNC